MQQDNRVFALHLKWVINMMKHFPFEHFLCRTTYRVYTLNGRLPLNYYWARMYNTHTHTVAKKSVEHINSPHTACQLQHLFASVFLSVCVTFTHSTSRGRARSQEEWVLDKTCDRTTQVKLRKLGEVHLSRSQTHTCTKYKIHTR